MHRIKPTAAAGFTLIEALIAMAIFGLLLAIGIPMMTSWTVSNKAASTTEFYAEGFKLARTQATINNNPSRIVLTPNANGQMDWQVDICFPAVGAACTSTTGAWSTVSAVSATPQGAASGFKSVFRAATGLSPAVILRPTITPANATAIYFTGLGWVDPTFAPRLARIDFTPAASYAASVRKTAVAVTLAGNVIKCDPDVVAADSRSCP